MSHRHGFKAKFEVAALDERDSHGGAEKRSLVEFASFSPAATAVTAESKRAIPKSSASPLLRVHLLSNRGTSRALRRGARIRAAEPRGHDEAQGEDALAALLFFEVTSTCFEAVLEGDLTDDAPLIVVGHDG
jgi:hypothetical protein